MLQSISLFTLQRCHVKPANFLVNDPLQGIVHLSDFGISKIKSNSTTYTSTKSNTMAGSVQYKAPELYSAKFKNITDKQDIYSLGIVMWEICHLQIPFEGCDALTIMGTVVQDECPLDFEEYVPKKYQELIQMCWRRQPEKRPSALDIISFLNHSKAELLIPNKY